MKFRVSASAFAALAILAQVTLANFDIYRVEAILPGFPTDFGWQIFESDPSCSEVASTPWYGSKSDVSGKTTGVRCKGDGCTNDNVRGIFRETSNKIVY